MIRSLRAAGAAAVAFALAGAAISADPLQANTADATPVTSTYLDHVSATTEGGVGNEVGGSTVAMADPFGHALAGPGIAIVQSLDMLVAAHGGTRTADAEQECLAGAVYFEARGEPLDGQLAVAEVVLNRVASERYPDTICAVVKQAAQFSFVRRGRFPRIDRDCDAWRKAVAIATIAQQKLAREVAPDVLWYHADYVSPSWGRRLNKVATIGAHIFYS